MACGSFVPEGGRTLATGVMSLQFVGFDGSQPKSPWLFLVCQFCQGLQIYLWDVLACCFTRFSGPDFTVRATVQLRIHQSRSHPPVRGAPTSWGRTHQSRSHPPTSQGRFALWHALCHSIVRSACPAMHSTNRNLPYPLASDRQAVPIHALHFGNPGDRRLFILQHEEHSAKGTNSEVRRSTWELIASL